jgi:hypothetical protein
MMDDEPCLASRDGAHCDFCCEHVGVCHCGIVNPAFTGRLPDPEDS